MMEFFIFWAVVVILCAALVYVSYQHFMLCKLRRKVDKDWSEISQTIERLDNKLKQIQDAIIDTEDRVEQVREDQITTRREADHVSLSVHKTIEDLVKKQNTNPIQTTLEASDSINVTNYSDNKAKKVAKMSSKKKKSQ